MEGHSVDPETVTIPRWTIKRDTRSPGCPFCRSAIVCVTTDHRQMAFCACRLVEYRLLPRPNVRNADSRTR